MVRQANKMDAAEQELNEFAEWRDRQEVVNGQLQTEIATLSGTMTQPSDAVLELKRSMGEMNKRDKGKSQVQEGEASMPPPPLQTPSQHLHHQTPPIHTPAPTLHTPAQPTHTFIPPPPQHPLQNHPPQNHPLPGFP